MITKIEENGTTFCSVGGIDPRTIVGQEVLIYAKERLHGVIGAKPPHVTSDEGNKAYELEEMFIDVALPEERVRKLVSVGT